MYVVVKIVEGNSTKGRGYTYESDMDLSIGDKVIADMAGNDKVLEVVDITSKPENVDFEIKKIKSLYLGEADSDGVLPDKGIDIIIQEEKLPVIKINFDDLKKELTETLTKYKGIVVTEQSLSGCKMTQKELAGLRRKIDNYRLEKKKELSLPIVAFEEQCKELIALVEQAENPIKEGIAVFDDAKRSEKVVAAKKIIADVVAKVGLNNKYAARMEIQDKYSNLTSTKGDVEDDAMARAMALKAEQDKEAELLAIIVDTIEEENKKINKKMSIEDFSLILDKLTTRDIIAEVKRRAFNIFSAEHPVETPVEIPDEKQEILPVDTQEEAKEDIMYFGVYRVWGELEKLKMLSAYLKTNHINYSVESEGEM